MSIEYKRVWVWLFTGMAFGCIGPIDTKDDPKTETALIMPYADGYLGGAYSSSGIQGGWYTYQNLGSNVVKFLARSAESSCWYNWGGKGNDDLNGDCRKPAEADNRVDRICVKGTLDRYDANDSPYVGVGVELCSSTENNKYEYQFPYTLETCPFLPDKKLLNRFVGVAFRVTNFEDGVPPEINKMVVQFKERRDSATEDRLPYCVLKGANNEDVEVSCLKAPLPENEVADPGAIAIEAYAGDLYKKVKTDNRGKSVREGVNLRMLQAIHFQVTPENPGESFSFCIEDLRAILSTTEIPEGKLLGGVNTIPSFFSDYNNPSQASYDEMKSMGIQWIDARDASGEEVADYPDELPFYITESEITVDQYYRYYTAMKNNHGDGDILKTMLKNWESCNAYRYHKTKDDPQSDPQEIKLMMEQPVNCVNWHIAQKFCNWVGGRLPNQKQWEYAARAGHLDADYPSGVEPDCDNSVISEFEEGGNGCGNSGVPETVCSKENGKTPTGLCDMLGNLWEWVDKDAWEVGEPDWKQGYKRIKGGGFNTEGGNSLSIESSTSIEHPIEPHSRTRVGFRCISYDINATETNATETIDTDS